MRDIACGSWRYRCGVKTENQGCREATAPLQGRVFKIQENQDW